MKITISHSQSTIDPAATVSDAAFPAVVAELERQYTAAIKAEYLDADVWFVCADCGDDGISISFGDETGDIQWEVKDIMRRVYEAGTFWNAATIPA